MLTKISQLRDIVERQQHKKTLVLASAADEHSLEAAFAAYGQGLINLILVGDAKKITAIAEEHAFPLDDQVRLVHELDPRKCVQISTELIRRGEADILMKGYITTAELMRGVLDKDHGLRENRVISHFALFEIPAYHKLLALTDVAMNISPDLDTKMGILNNSIDFMNRLGVEKPKVAVLAAVEMVNEKMPATLDAALLTVMAKRGQIRNCVIDGPLAFDNAISFQSSEHKGIHGEVAGDADLLLVPDIEAGNVLYKAFVFFVQAKVASIILGARVPIVLTSRADSEETKLNSILLAAASSEF